MSNIDSDNSQNVGLEDYNNISVGIFPHFTTPSIKISLGLREFVESFQLYCSFKTICNILSSFFFLWVLLLFLKKGNQQNIRGIG